MPNEVIIYNSKYGFTKKYAIWISEILNCDIFQGTEVSKISFNKYNTIIWGGGLYAGGVNGIKQFKKIFPKIKDKKIVLFTCGLADVSNIKNTNNIINMLKKSLSDEIFNKIKIFHLRGGIDYSELNFVHKSMMSMVNKITSKKPNDELTDEDKEMLETYGQKVDFCDKKYIKSLIQFVEENR